MNFKKIMVVDDDDDYQKIYFRFLTDLGVPFEQIYNGLEAIKVLENGSYQDYSMLILDLQLPGADGLQVAQTVKKICPALKICCVTANIEQFDKAQLLASGIQYFVQKPFDIKDISNLIDQGIELKL